MRLIIIDRRRLKVFCIVLLLMGVLYGVGGVIKGQLNPVSFMQNNVKSLKRYKALDGQVSYGLPSAWECKSKSFQGNQIIYHNEFVSKDMTIYGFVQVWNKEEDLKSFLDNSKKYSEKENEIEDYRIKKIDVNGNEGYYTKYNIKQNKNCYVANEYFIKYKKGFVRLSFFNNKENYKGHVGKLYDTILKTIQLK